MQRSPAELEFALRRWVPQLCKLPIGFKDLVAATIQILWLILFRISTSASSKQRLWNPPRFLLNFSEGFTQAFHKLLAKLQGIATRIDRSHENDRNVETGRPLVPIALALVFSTILVSTPLYLMGQTLFAISFIGVALLLSLIRGETAGHILLGLSLIASTRYLWWRYSYTLNWTQPFDLATGILLLGAETYAWLVLVLGFLQSSASLKRKPVPLPENPTEWPNVDILIPTYNEPLHILKPTVFGAQGIDWPRNKLTIHILDDGKRPEIALFAAQAGVGYITRSQHTHAKAGNLNHALQQLSGDLVVVFDCDHVPTRSFLQLTVGWFLKDPKLALLQTPHHYFSPDPFEKNLGHFRTMPNEGRLFYSLIQDSNDTWNAAMFCGSSAVIKRAAIDAVGGFAVDTVTEDAHTSLRMHRRGYNTAYLNVPLAAGLATESLTAHVVQRMRWGRGMVQIFRSENPLLGPGLKWPQRLCYFSSMLHFLGAWPRLIFLTAAPVFFLMMHSYMITASAWLILAYAMPHLLHATIANHRLQGSMRRPFWGQIYEVVLSWTIALATTAALWNPKAGKFHVTVKGGQIDSSRFEWQISTHILILILLNMIGLGWGAYRLINGPTNDYANVGVNLIWTLYNLFVLGAALAVADESRQVRQSTRVRLNVPAHIRLDGGKMIPVVIEDFSDRGLRIKSNDLTINHTDKVELIFADKNRTPMPATVVHTTGNSLGLSFLDLTMEQEKLLIQQTFGRADNWIRWYHAIPYVSFWDNFKEVVRVSIAGYKSVGYYLAPAKFRQLARAFCELTQFLKPKPIQLETMARHEKISV